MCAWKKNDLRLNPLSISLPEPNFSLETEYASNAVVRVQKSCLTNVPQPKLMHLHNIWAEASGERKRGLVEWRVQFFSACATTLLVLSARACTECAPNPTEQPKPPTHSHSSCYANWTCLSRRTTIHRPLLGTFKSLLGANQYRRRRGLCIQTLSGSTG